ncbi:unnamed protein product [Bathycoccus prasinos]
MSATAAHSSRRSSRHKVKEESVKEEESNDLTEISNVQLVREAIEEDQEDINSPLRSMRNLEDVTMTFNTNNVIKETDNAKKTRMKTPKTRSTKKKTKKQEKVFEEPPFSPLMKLENDDFLVKGEGRDQKFNMPPSTHKRWTDDDNKSPIVVVKHQNDTPARGMSNTDEDAGGFKLDFLDDDHAVLNGEEEDGAVEDEDGTPKETHENVDATEEILARVNARNLTWHKQPEHAKFYGGVVEFGQQQPQMMGTLMSTPGFHSHAQQRSAVLGIPPTPLANTAVPWPNEHTNEGMNTEAFLNGIASFQGGFNEDDANFARGEGPLPGTPIFQHQRTPASGNGGSVGNIRTNFFSAELRRTKTEILDCQDRRKRLRDTLIALREKEEKLYAKAAEMQRELLRRDPSKALELGGASIFEALPPLGDDVVLREEKAEEKTKEERGVAAEAKEEEVKEEALTMTTATKNSEKEEQETKQIQMEEDRRNASKASASTSTRKFTSKISQTYDVHRSVLSMQFLDPSSWLDGQTSLLAASADDVIRLYASDSRKPFALMRTEKGLSCVGTTLKDRVAFCATKFGGVSQIDLATGEKIGTVVQNYEQLRVNKSIECMATSTTTGTDDNILVCAGEGSAIRVWDARCANSGAAPLTFHAPGARNVSSVALGGGESGHTTLLASAPTSSLFAFDLRVNSSSSSPGERGGGGQISRLSVPNFEKQPRWVNAKFCAANEIFAIACDGDAATFEASGEFKATSAFAGVSAPFQMASPSFSSSASKSFVKTGGILETSADGAHVLVSTGDIGNGVQCFNTSTGAIVASWDEGSIASSSPISCACWGHFNASAKEPFGKDAFAIADTKGSIKVFGV